MSDDKNKEPRDNSENTPRERPKQDDLKWDIPAEPEGIGGFIGESQEQQDNLRKAMEIPPKPPVKPTKDSDNDSKEQ